MKKARGVLAPCHSLINVPFGNFYQRRETCNHGTACGSLGAMCSNPIKKLKKKLPEGWWFTRYVDCLCIILHCYMPNSNELDYLLTIRDRYFIWPPVNSVCRNKMHWNLNASKMRWLRKSALDYFGSGRKWIALIIWLGSVYWGKVGYVYHTVYNDQV